MANALPHAIGIQAASPGRQVISLSGDGGFAMLMGDILTLTQERLPVKVVIYNNGTLGFVELEMKAAGYLETGVTLENPDFAAMARAIGIHAPRPGPPRRGDEPPGTGDAAEAPGRAGEGVQPLRAPGRDERTRRRDPRSGQDQPAALNRFIPNPFDPFGMADLGFAQPPRPASALRPRCAFERRRLF
jgi:hypothetical protein